MERVGGVIAGCGEVEGELELDDAVWLKLVGGGEGFRGMRPLVMGHEGSQRDGSRRDLGEGLDAALGAGGVGDDEGETVGDAGAEIPGDGILDLVMTFSTSNTGLRVGDTSVRLSGVRNTATGPVGFNLVQAVKVINRRY